MRFYNRESEIGILIENEQQAGNSATFTVLIGH